MQKIVTLIAAAALALSVGFTGTASAQTLLAYYSFDASNGGLDATDDSPNSNDGTVTDATADCADTPSTPGNVCSAVSDGDGDFVDVGAVSVGSGNFTAAAWVKTTQNAANKNVLIAFPTPSNSFNSDPGWTLQVHNGDVHATLSDGSNRINVTGGSVNDGEWRHIAVVRLGNTVKVYSDGTLDNSGAIGTLGSVDNSPNVLTISNAVNALDGKIDEVRIYNRALTDAEVAQLATTFTIEKELVSATEEVGTTNENGLIDLFEEWGFVMKVTVENLGPGTLNLTVKDPLPGDLELGDDTSENNPPKQADGACPDSSAVHSGAGSVGDVSTEVHGKTDKCTVNWNIGNLADGEIAMLTITASTDENPGGGPNKPHQEYTDFGPYCINQGATLLGTAVEVPFEQDSNGLELDNVLVDTEPDVFELQFDLICDDGIVGGEAVFN